MSLKSWESFEKHAEELLELNGTKGAIVAVAVDGEKVYEKDFGWRDEEEQLPIDSETVCGIGSITKSFTGVGIMQLHEQGKLSVTDLVTKYLPEFKLGDGAEKYITIHHLLTHTAGMPPLGSLNRALVRSYWEDEVMMADEEKAEELKKLEPIDDYKELIGCIAEDKSELLGFPGEYFSYSNDSWALLGGIIAEVSGMGYEEYIIENVLKPLGMTRSVFSKDEVVKFDNVATLYTIDIEDGEEVVKLSPSWWEAPSMSAAGFLKSTANDMLRYLEIYRKNGMGVDNRILKKESMKQLSTPYAVTTPGLPYEYGYGVMIHLNYHGNSLVEHGGNIKGVAAWMTCIPEKGITAVALTNTSGAPAGGLVLGAINNLLDLPVKTPRHDLCKYDCPKERLEDYVGSYGTPEGASLKVEIKDDQLVYIMETINMDASPVGVDLFSMKYRGSEMISRFLKNKQGDVWALAMGFRVIPKIEEKEDECCSDDES